MTCHYQPIASTTRKHENLREGVKTRPTGHEAPALLKHHSSASFISIINHSSALLALLALLKLLALLVLLALLALSKLLALSCVILESS